MKPQLSLLGFTLLVVTAILSAPVSTVGADTTYDPITASFVQMGSGTPIPPTKALSQSVLTLYGVNITTDDLLTIDVGTAAATVVAQVGSPIVAGLADDPSSGLFYSTDTGTNNLVTIGPSNGATTVIGPTGVGLLHGLALDPTSGILYASDADGFGPSNLWRVDKTTGAAVLVGPMGFNSVAGLDFDHTTGVLYGSRSGADAAGFLITIDLSTGAGMLVGSSTRLAGLAFDINGQLYGQDNGGVSDGISRLYLVDKNTGAATLIGPIVSGNVLGIDFSADGAVQVQSESWGSLKARYRGANSSGR
jgi:hypothetical protein